MSLQVWLPLTKDLRNQGLSDVTVTNNGATFNSAGKLGGCYSFDGDDDFINFGTSINSIITGGSSSFSIAFWIKSLENGTRGVIFSSYNLPSASNFFSLEINSGSITNNSLRFDWLGADIKYFTGVVTYNEWIHLTVTYDGTTIKCYKNGTLFDSITRTLNILTSENSYYLGRDARTGTTAFNGLMNDFRLYDHCLSPMEVKQLSQGLVLHYPLNRGGWGQENLLSNESSNWGKYSCVNGNYSGSSSRFAPYKITIPIEASTEYICHIKDHLNLGQAFYVGVHQLDSNLTFLNDSGWKLVPYSFTSRADAAYVRLTFRDALNNATNIQSYVDAIGEKLLIKLEKGSIPTPWCPNSSDELATTLGLNGTTEYDCSGYCNNGTRIGTFSFNSDTPKYSVSTEYNGTDNTLIIPFNANIWQTNFTMNIWFKKNELGSKNFETLFGGPSGFEMDTRSGSSTSLSLYMASTRGGNVYTGFQFGEWYMVTLVNDGTNELYYINGELVKTIEKKSMPIGTYYIGSWKGVGGQNYKGLISDARVYATALSPSDVKSLYQNSAYIDSFGNVYGAVHVED